MVLNKLLNLEPYICVNMGFGDAYSAAEEVEYVSGSVNTPMGKWRAANGHPEPYKVTWWNIGNEMWNPQQMGFMSVEHYWVKHNMFAEAMRRVDPKIKIVSSSASPVETSQSHSAIVITGKHVAEFGGPADLPAPAGPLLGLFRCGRRTHLSLSGDQAFDAGKQDFVKVEEPLVGYARKIANGVHCVWRPGRSTSGDSRISRWIVTRWRSMNGSPNGSENVERIPPAIRCLRPWLAPRRCMRCSITRTCSSFGVHRGVLIAGHQQDRCDGAADRADVRNVPAHFGTIPVEVSGTLRNTR